MPGPTSNSVAARRRFILLAGIGTLPSLLVLAFGLHATHRETALAELAARDEATRLAIGAADDLAEYLFQPSLPSQADLKAFVTRPSKAADDPCLAISRTFPGALARFFGEDFAYPPSPPPPDAPSSRLPFEDLPDAIRSAWLRAEQSVLPHAERVPLWRTALHAAAESPAEGALRLQTARALLQAGQTRAAAELLLPLTQEPEPWPSATGLPLSFLAWRSLLHVAEVDPAALRGPPNTRMDTGPVEQLARLVLVRHFLPTALLDEFRENHGPVLARWRELAGLHARIRDAFPAAPLPARPQAGEDTPSLPRPIWLTLPSGSLRLVSLHEVGDGRWHLSRDLTDVQASVEAWLRGRDLPEHLASEISLAQQTVVPSSGTLPVLGSAGNSRTVPGLVQVRFRLSRPDVLARSVEIRSRRLLLLTGLAFLTTLAASIAVLWAYARQRRLAELQTDFVAAVTHELRAPLAAIRLIAEELTDLPETESQRRSRYHQLVLREIGRLGLLIDNVLRHSRLERDAQPLDLALTDLREIVESVRDTFLPTAQDRGIPLQVQLPAAPVSTSVDAQAIRQVFANLVDNALKHSPPGAAVELILEALPAPDSVAVLSVVDQGPGIPAIDHERIFQPFYRRGSELRRETAGVGLGLALVHKLVLAHRGTVKLVSEPGRGTRFTVRLPLTHPGSLEAPRP